MGLRFRKSLKIAPGVKINLSKSGGSLSLGGRGATINISNRGIRSTYGIPGTGISYVTQASLGKKGIFSSSHSDSNTSPNNIFLREQKEEQDLLRSAEEAHRISQADIDSLLTILKNREKQPFDWEGLTVSRGIYQPEVYKPSSFVEPEKLFSKEMLKKTVRIENSRLYISYLLVGIAFILFFQSLLASFSMFLFAVASYAFEKNRLDKLCSNQRLQARLQQENENFKHVRQQAYNDYLTKVELEKSEHQNAEEKRRKIWNREEKYRERLRNAVSAQDLEPLSRLIEGELSNEILPISLAFDVEFVNVNSVNIFMELPDFCIVPEEEMDITEADNIFLWEIAQQERFKIYSDICAGLTLRLIYEIFRIIYSVDIVEFCGLAEQVNPVNGCPENIASLYIRVPRKEFEKINLDASDPTSIFENLNGQFNFKKDK